MQHPSYYFSSELNLLQEVKSVWEILTKLEPYIHSKPLGTFLSKVPSGVIIENPDKVFIGSNVVLEPGVYIKGAAYIGEGCQVRHGAYLRGNVALEEGSVVGHCSEVKNSLLLPQAHAAHFNYVGESVLGAFSNLGAGSRCANYRLDQKEIWIRVEGKKISTGLKKMGVILGDRSQIGCNAVMSPGTLIGQDVIGYPCAHIRGFIPSGATVQST